MTKRAPFLSTTLRKAKDNMVDSGNSEQIGPSSNLGPSEQIQPSSNLSPKQVPEQNGPTSNLPKKTRGRNKLRLIESMRKIADVMHPITGRGIGYKLFTAALIESMSTGNMSIVYRALKVAREDGIIRWDWIIDETRDLEMVNTWRNGSELADTFFYRRDLWQSQPVNVEVWSEKGTVRGVLWPVLAELGVGFRVMHGFSSATCVHDVSNNGNDDRPLVALYVGDRDPSGLCMTEIDLPKRIKEYGGTHIELRRIALTAEQARGLPGFSVEDKKKDPRYKWYKQNYGGECWELDAMDPRVLRDLVRTEIKALINDDLWAQQEAMQKREQNSIELALSIGGDPDSTAAIMLRQNHEIERWCSLYEAFNKAAA